ncbi:MAG: hypothetical protein MZV63_61485 [Marinilabiliales bacterium]|nr:hypothetical protein [Marinilabiliales bacterium]
MNPAIKFDILLPTADEQTREYLRVATDTEERLSRQFVYLLVMNSFYPDPALYSGSASGSGGQVTQTTATGCRVSGCHHHYRDAFKPAQQLAIADQQ